MYVQNTMYASARHETYEHIGYLYVRIQKLILQLLRVRDSSSRLKRCQ
jgi:hypothetical protein